MAVFSTNLPRSATLSLRAGLAAWISHRATCGALNRLTARQLADIGYDRQGHRLP